MTPISALPAPFRDARQRAQIIALLELDDEAVARIEALDDAGGSFAARTVAALDRGLVRLA
ncbi:hypothetical protein DKT77_14160 [Meridianimarinicoccus roseus]|jgi:hypothetical protein|uniref:Uncharacterized protein n=1 Tax=Meridianimarinicoccus roseus TaxID=2072018 RepID=A0A2V2LDR9_9RHOB|nr:hypothetical protein [Meridianimarinicoccus roseus]PWR01951.1 hypothetical protein DKT77_14160 [Meridianimarinicoccus roseus]